MFKTLLQKNRIASQKSTASSFLLEKAEHYLHPLQQQLLEQIDQRLVNTFYNLFISILLFRNGKMALLLSELGGFICGHVHAPTGTKRISNLLRCPKWEASWIDTFFFEKTKKRINQLSQVRKRALLLWDDSRVEKPESWFLEGLCRVESSKAKRLTKVKKGFYNHLQLAFVYPASTGQVCSYRPWVKCLVCAK